MFPPDSPPPTKYRRTSVKKPSSYTSEDKGTTLWVRALQILFVLVGVGGIAYFIISAPKEKPLICDRSTTAGRSSLTAFGSCAR